MEASMLANPVPVAGLPSRYPRFNPCRGNSSKRFIFLSPTPASGLSAKIRDPRILLSASSLATGKEGYGKNEEPFWLTLLKDVIWSVRFLISFLAEQPGQLKYIEWPSFQSTMKTATLTLVLVAALIVALSSVDSGLCYVLALVLRKAA